MSDIRVFQDIGYAVTADKQEYYVKFRVYRLFTVDDEVMYEAWNEGGAAYPEPDISKAAVFLEGTVKFDGCGDLRFTDGLNNAHFCGRVAARQFGTLLDRLWDIAAELLQTGHESGFDPE